MNDDQRKKKPAGRPRKYSGKRPTWTVRLEESVGERVKKFSAETGRSISEACEALIMKGLFSDTQIRVLEQQIQFREMQRLDLENRVQQMESEHLAMLEDAADAHEDSGEPQKTLADVIEEAVERGVRRAFERKD